MIIGLTGSLAAGKGVVSDFLKEKGFVYISLSDELREILKENKVQLTRENLQDWGNKLRKEQGTGVLAKIAVKKIIEQQYSNAIVDGIRNPSEIDELKELKSFVLVCVDASEKIRFERMKGRDRESDPNTSEEFKKVDARDKGKGEPKDGQQVGKCMKRAKFVLMNEGSLEEVRGKIEQMYDDIDRKMPRPTWDEYFMEIAKTVAKRATCNRGRSGCVIAKDKRLLVTGYVGSPIGLPHCDEIGHQMKKMIHEDGSESQHCVRTTHAEQNAICQAAKIGVSIEGATLYCSMTPCAVCAKLIINSGIKKVVAEKRYHRGQESEEMFKKSGVKLIILNDETVKYKNM